MVSARRHRSLSRVTVGTVVLCAGLASCGGDDEPGPGGATDVVATSPTGPATAVPTSSGPPKVASTPSPTSPMPSAPETSDDGSRNGSTIAESTARVIVTLERDVVPSTDEIARELDDLLGDEGTVTRVFAGTGQLVAEVTDVGRKLLEDHPQVAQVDDDTADDPDG